jgi:hypothetical protein
MLSTDKLSDVCLSLISFDRNLRWSLYIYFLGYIKNQHDANWQYVYY